MAERDAPEEGLRVLAEAQAIASQKCRASFRCGIARLKGELLLQQASASTAPLEAAL